MARKKIIATTAVALVLGIAVGVALDRAYLAVQSRGPTHPALVGRWETANGSDPREFFADGTYTRTIPTFDMTGKGAVASPLMGEWKWVSDDQIEMEGFGEKYPQVRVVVAGDSMKLIFGGGKVTEYRRK